MITKTYMVQILRGGELEMGEDYDLLTYAVYDGHKLRSYYEYVGVNFDQFIKIDQDILTANLEATGKKYFDDILPMFNYEGINNRMFNIKDVEPNVDLAYQAGLGAVRFLKGNLKGQVFFFDFLYGEWLGEQENNYMFKFKMEVYKMLVLNHYVSPVVKQMFEEEILKDELFIASLCSDEAYIVAGT
ncbi:hypothetical protein ACLIA0_12935 [Bacillaceae bacterium W0354]